MLRPLIAALGNLGDSHAFPALAELTEHLDGFVRQDAARALGKLGDRQAVPVIKRLLKDHTKPERRDDSGFMSILSTRSVADETKTALRQLRWWRFW